MNLRFIDFFLFFIWLQEKYSSMEWNIDKILWSFLLISRSQIHTAIQQPGFKRVKRGFRTLKSPAAISNNPIDNDKETNEASKIPTDPYFPLQWYLRNTGQNGGKPRLDLNVQAAWDQGITGKNVTTAIMDDGEF